jgi:hypothetical protein
VTPPLWRVAAHAQLRVEPLAMVATRTTNLQRVRAVLALPAPTLQQELLRLARTVEPVNTEPPPMLLA